MEWFALPALLALWALSPFCIRQGDEAKKTPLFAVYPRESKGGNNPASQRVHEGGGFRLGALLTVAVQVGIGALGFALIGTALAQFVAIPLVFIATRRFIDLAEHGAEIIHADSHDLPHNVKAWMSKRNFSSYRDAEAHRMTQRHQEYEGMTTDEWLEAVDRKRWLSRIILILGRW